MQRLFDDGAGRRTRLHQYADLNFAFGKVFGRMLSSNTVELSSRPRQLAAQSYPML